MAKTEFIKMGYAHFNDVIIKDYSTSYNGGLFITIAKDNAPAHFIGVQVNNNGNNDIARLRDLSIHIDIDCELFKNPKTERVLYIINNPNGIVRL